MAVFYSLLQWSDHTNEGFQQEVEGACGDDQIGDELQRPFQASQDHLAAVLAFWGHFTAERSSCAAIIQSRTGASTLGCSVFLRLRSA